MRSDAGDVAAAAELALLAQGGPELTSTQLMVQLLDELVAIDGSAEAMQNVESTRVKALAALMGCGTVSVMGAKVTLDFGAAPGCVSKNGVQVSGVVSLGVSKTNTTTTLLVTFGNAVLGAKTLDGELTFSTTNGQQYSVTGNLTGTKDTQYSLTFALAEGGVTLNGNVAATRSGQLTTVMMGSIFWSAGDCYPKGGQALKDPHESTREGCDVEGQQAGQAREAARGRLAQGSQDYFAAQAGPGENSPRAKRVRLVVEVYARALGSPPDEHRDIVRQRCNQQGRPRRAFAAPSGLGQARGRIAGTSGLERSTRFAFVICTSGRLRPPTPRSSTR